MLVWRSGVSNTFYTASPATPELTPSTGRGRTCPTHRRRRQDVDRLGVAIVDVPHADRHLDEQRHLAVSLIALVRESRNNARRQTP
jgi:hypothetical protein